MGEAELRTGSSGVAMNDLPGRSPLSDGRVDKEDESTGGVDAPQRAQTDGTAGAITLGRRKVGTPLVQTTTGTRYGRGLTGAGGGTNRQWGGGTPVCPKCGKMVYFAEQVSEKKETLR